MKKLILITLIGVSLNANAQMNLKKLVKMAYGIPPKKEVPVTDTIKNDTVNRIKVDKAVRKEED